MNKWLNIVKKIFLEKEFDENGFIYEFVSIEQYDVENELSFKFNVSVKTPREHQSYILVKFQGDVEDILINIWKYIGTKFSYYIDIVSVNGEEPEGEVYITPEKRDQIEKKVNEVIKDHTYKTKHTNIDFDVYFKLGTISVSSTGNIDFEFKVYVSNFTENGKKLIPDMDKIDDIASAINTDMNEDDDLRSTIEDIIYNITEPELRIQNMDDVYYNVYFEVQKVDGIKDLSLKGWGSDIEREYFT